MQYGDDVSGHYDLACQYYSLGNYEQACHYFASALAQIGPGDDQALPLYCRYSQCLYIRGECAQALSTAERGLSFFPDCRELFYLRGQIYYEIGLLQQSLANFTRCSALKTRLQDWPDGGDGADYKVYWYLTAISAREGQIEAALYHLGRFLKEKPPLPLLKKLFLLLIKSALDVQTLVKSIPADNLSNDMAFIRLLLDLEAYEAGLEAIEHSGTEKEGLRTEWVQCQLYLGRFDQVQHMLEPLVPSLLTADQELIIYYCISKWLQSPRRSARQILLQLDDNSAEVQACLEVEQLIFNNMDTSHSNTGMDISAIIKKIALTVYRLGDICLALEIIENYLAVDRKNTYAELGREAFAGGFFPETKILLERCLSPEGGNAQDFYKLGLACTELEQYEPAVEYFLSAMTLQPGNPIYPCLVYETAAVQAMETLVQGSDGCEDNPELINELLHLCTIKRRSNQLRRIFIKPENEGGSMTDTRGCSHTGSAAEDNKREEVWNINV